MAAEFAIGVGAVSKAMDRIEERALIERLPNPTNRRSMILAVTAAGQARVGAAETTFLRRLDEILAEAGTAEQVAAAALVLRSLRAALEREDLGAPVG